MKNIYLTLLLLAFISVSYSKQNESLVQDKSFPIIYSNEIPGLDSVSTDYFEGDGLFGFINGGADLYLEYGFERVAAQEFKLDSETLKLDIYKMKDERAAFGIYSISVFDCKNSNKVFTYDCVTPYQILGIAGNYYIMLTNNSGSQKAQEYSVKIAENIKKKASTRKEKEKEIDVAIMKGFTCKFITGKLGLQNGFSDWVEYFTDIQKFEMYLFKYEEGSIYLNFADINFKSDDDEKIFYKNTGFSDIKFIDGKAEYTKNGVYKKIEKSMKYTIGFIESNTTKDKVESLMNK